MFVLKNNKGQYLQSWSFGSHPSLIWCKSYEWAMKFQTQKKAAERMLWTMFPDNKFKPCNIKIVEVTTQVNYIEKGIV